MSVWQRDHARRLYRIELEQVIVELTEPYTKLFDNFSTMADDENTQGDNEYHNDPPVRSLKDYLQPTRTSTPSCMVFPDAMEN